MKFIVAFLALVLTGWFALPALAADDALSIDANLRYLDENKKQKGWIIRPSGLQFRILQNGYGKRPQSTDEVKVYYTGKLINGTIFDGTSPGLPASFKLSSGLINGWVEAMLLMREGDHWQLVIPPTLGYGARGNGPVPPNQTLLFDIKLLETTPAPRKGEKGYIPDPGDKDDEQQ
jgi:FKBP-type peptidyl-prolyl cis-trans isomerase FkpA/FKBP-type peptidyl-prolyl cis-trans isomerase FklB